MIASRLDIDVWVNVFEVERHCVSLGACAAFVSSDIEMIA